VPGAARQIDNGCPDPLTPTGDKKTSWLHGFLSGVNRP
jgi:hypothetical protein